ncbi:MULTISPECIES: hypothetical protein [unclassified Bradyrhizobium]|uniref:hypothetical protein n=1 Tax=unclassified Bradyrhizobium TaxID=2631580 RepID=UPI002915C741|nr:MULTISPECIES: hypothetical protein [unclassified Bradyrhizobium]
MSTNLVYFPDARALLGIGDNATLKKLLRAHGVKWIAFNSRRLAVRRADLDLLLTLAEAA